MFNNHFGAKRNMPFRSGRFFNIDEKWYFASRDGVDRGPFSSKSEAEKALEIFLEECRRYDAVRGK